MPSPPPEAELRRDLGVRRPEKGGSVTGCWRESGAATQALGIPGCLPTPPNGFNLGLGLGRAGSSVCDLAGRAFEKWKTTLMSARELGGAVHSSAGMKLKAALVCICTHNSDCRGSCPLCSMSGSLAPGSQAISTAPPPALTVGLSLLTAGCVLLCKLAQVRWVPCARLMGVGPVAETRLPSCLFCGATPHVCSSSVPACPARLPASPR